MERRRRRSDRRGKDRSKRRLPCDFGVEGQRHRGIIRDVSHGGVFIQTTASVLPGKVVDLRIPASGKFPEMGLRGVVARRRQVPARLAGLDPPGLGVQILEAPEIYYQLVVGRKVVDRRGAGAKAEQTQEPTQPYRVRVTQSEGTRSRTLKITATSEEAARKEALTRVGQGWEVVEISTG